MTEQHRSDTLLAHASAPRRAAPDIANPPVYHASTVLFPTLDALEGRDPAVAYSYGRHGTPTTDALREAVRQLEGADEVFLAPSGLAAITAAILSFARRDGHILITDSVYQPVREFMDGMMTRFGVRAQYYDPRIGAGIDALIRPETCLIFMESPGSLTFEIQDIPAIAQLARRRGVPTVVDATWGGGYFMKALALGADVSVQAATKHIVGHSDALMGTIACNRSVAATVGQTVALCGACPGPDDVYLALRGLRSMGVRLRRQYDSGLEIATWLAKRPEVEKVIHPALPTHPDHALWRRDFTGACGLFGFVMRAAPRPALAAMMNELKIFGMGFSWGGYESLLIPTRPAGSRSAVVWTEQGQAMRIAVGLEDPQDLMRDLAAGFDRWARAGGVDSVNRDQA